MKRWLNFEASATANGFNEGVPVQSAAPTAATEEGHVHIAKERRKAGVRWKFLFSGHRGAIPREQELVASASSLRRCDSAYGWLPKKEAEDACIDYTYE